MQARNDGSTIANGLRLTWQINQSNKLNLFWDEQRGCNGSAWIGTTAQACRHNPDGWIEGGTSSPRLIAPETGVYGIGAPAHPAGDLDQHAHQQDAVRVRLQRLQQPLGRPQAPGNPTQDFIQVREQGGRIPGLCYRAISTLCGAGFATSTGWISANTWHANLSYVTGSHNFKFGYNGLYDYDNQDSNFANSQGLVYQFNNGVPNQFWQLSGMFKSQWRTRYDAFFAQDSWTRDRLTLQGALRYEHAWSYYPESYIGGTRFIPFSTIPEADGANFNDVMPRAGLAYDLFGNGRTSLKVNWGKYVQPAQNDRHLHRRRADLRDRDGRHAELDRRERELRRRLQPDESGRVGSDRVGRRWLRRAVEQQLRHAESGLHLQLAAPERSAALGLPVRHRHAAAADVADFGRSAVEQALVRRPLREPQYRDQPSDWNSYNITAPVDARLPGGGGYAVTGLHDIAPAKFGQANYQVQPAGNYGVDAFQYWSGVDVTLAMRASKGLTFQGGTSTGQTVQDFCGVSNAVPDALLAPQPLAVGVASPVSGRSRHHALHAVGHGAGTVLPPRVRLPHAVQGLSSYQVPKVDVEVSATFQSKPGAQLAANYNVPAATIAGFLGRAPSGGVANVTVNISRRARSMATASTSSICASRRS